MPRYDTQPIDFTGMLDRREFLGNMSTGLGSIALTCLLAGEARSEPSRDENPLSPRSPHFAPKAKRVIQIFCPGAVS